MLNRHGINLTNYPAMRVAHSNITTKIVCPAPRCGSSLHRITRVTQTAAGITPRIARAAGLGRHHELFLCHNCGCVWRRDFDIDQLMYTSVILGEYHGLYSHSSFLPELWVQRAIFNLDEETE